MIETEIVVGAELRITCAKSDLAHALARIVEIDQRLWITFPGVRAYESPRSPCRP